MSNFTVLYDACVLYPAPLRDLLMEVALTDLYRAKWTNEIHEEWIRNVLNNRADLKKEQLERTRDLMNYCVLDSLVENYKQFEKIVSLPDPGDCHVLAAAIASGANVIVTYNLKDFPSSELSKYEIEAQHPDVFLMHLLDLDEHRVLAAIKRTRARLKNPPKTVGEYLKILEKQNLNEFVGFLKSKKDFI